MKKNKWSIIEQALFLKCIGELLERGYSLSEAVQSSSYYLPDNKHEDIHACIGSLKRGDSFFDSLITLKFNDQIISYVYFAEKHGGFANSFQAASKMIMNRQQTVKKLKKIFYYPLFLIFFTIILFFFVQQILLPQFTVLFQSMNVQQNIFMQFIIITGKIMPVLLMVLAVFLLSILYYFKVFYQKKDNITKCNLLVGIPFIGKFFSLFYSHIISLQLSYLLASGFSIYESLQLFQKNEHQGFFSEIGTEVISLLKLGDPLDQAFISISFLENEFLTIINHGQKNGRLDQELLFFSTHCMNLLEEKINTTLKKIQPCLYSFVGILIISIYLAVLLPMFKLLDGF